MDTALAQLAYFSDWTLAILPRLFMYPGGVWALIMLFWLYFVRGGPQALKPRTLAVTLLGSKYPAVATAWVALALLPLPGTEVLPFPVDRFSLAGLLLTSFLLSTNLRKGTLPTAYLSVSVAMLLAVMSPIAGGRALLPGDVTLGLPDWVSLTAIMVGLSALTTQAGGLENDMRWLAWLGMGASPLWVPGTQALLPGIAWTGLFYLVSITTLVGAGRLVTRRRLHMWLETTCWALAASSLLLALLG